MLPCWRTLCAICQDERMSEAQLTYPPSRFLRRISRGGSSSARIPSAEARAGFRAAQRFAYRCVEEIGRDLREGMTERQIAALLGTYCRDHGARLSLHTPFCWIGTHSRFDPYNERYGKYLPSDRALGADDIFILDVSPVVDGYIGDIGWTSSLQPQPALDAARSFLRELRTELPRLFESEPNTAAVWARVHERITTAGYDDCHAKYPFRVLGHRVYRIPPWFERLRLPRVPFGLFGGNWFSTQGTLEFLSHGFFSELLTPSNAGTTEGLWAIEPHIGGAGFGAKFEELLLVENGRAQWLDDEVPHMRSPAANKPARP